MRVGIVGAGIGGLAAAVALRHKGIDVAVYEQTPEPRAVGAGLHLWTNAVRALEEIGLGHVTDTVAVPIETEQIFTSTGRQLVEWPVGEVARRIGTPSIGLNRPDLVRFLLENLGDGVLHGNRRLVAFEDDGDGVSLRFADGSDERCDLLVGADGLNSSVRELLHGRSRPRYAGYTTWRTLIPRDPAHAQTGVLRQYWGRGARFVFFPAGAEQVYFVGLVNAPTGESDPPGGAKSALVSHFSALRIRCRS
jgi:2-polyprenyl-6-methoxyphenol hydroxylase-like FAD-dependent oxidoreductase